MKTNKILFWTAAIAAICVTATLWVSCSDDEPNEPAEQKTIFFNPEKVTVGYKAGEYSFTLVSEYDWTVSSFTENITGVTPQSGSGNEKIIFTISENEDVETPRQASITFRTAGPNPYTATFDITQANLGTFVLDLYPESTSVPYHGGDILVTVLASTDWSAIAVPEGFEVYPENGGEGQTEVTVAAPVDMDGNSYDIVFAVDEYPEQTAVLTLNYVKPAISLNMNDYYMDDFEGGEVTVTVSSTLPWKASYPAGVELSVEEGQGNATVTVTVYPNSEVTEAEYDIVFSTATSDFPDLPSARLLITQSYPCVVHGGREYSIIYHKERWWMATNLAYLPEGYTVSDDPSDPEAEIFYPYHDGEIVKDPELIGEYGYLYKPGFAFGAYPGSEGFNETNYGELAGIQGICPDGWHIPTYSEWFNEFRGELFAEWYQDLGFSINPQGFINCPDSGSVPQYAPNPQMIALGSTVPEYEQDEGTGVITSYFQGFYFIFDRISGVIYSSAFGAYSVRCVKN